MKEKLECLIFLGAIIKADTWHFVDWKQATASSRVCSFAIRNWFANFQNCFREDTFRMKLIYVSKESCVICMLEYCQTSKPVHGMPFDSSYSRDAILQYIALIYVIYIMLARPQVFRVLFMQRIIDWFTIKSADRIDSNTVLKAFDVLCFTSFLLFSLIFFSNSILSSMRVPQKSINGSQTKNILWNKICFVCVCTHKIQWTIQRSVQWISAVKK